MQSQQKKMTIAAVACGIVCAACVIGFMASVQHQADEARAETLARYGGEQVEVCVATRDILAGERVDAGAVQMKLWVSDLLPEDPVRLPSEVVGKTATSGILKGEVVSARRFDAARDTLEVPPGKVAISVPAKDVQAVGGSLLPGMKVDVYASGDTTTTLLTEGISVLATSVAKEGSSLSGLAWVTLAAAPEKVQEIIAAANRSSLYFTLPGEPFVETANASSGAASSASGAAKAASGAAQNASGSASATSAASSTGAASSSSSKTNSKASSNTNASGGASSASSQSGNSAGQNTNENSSAESGQQ